LPSGEASPVPVIVCIDERQTPRPALATLAIRAGHPGNSRPSRGSVEGTGRWDVGTPVRGEMRPRPWASGCRRSARGRGHRLSLMRRLRRYRSRRTLAALCLREPTGLPNVLLLEPRGHYARPGDLPDGMAAELGLMITEWGGQYGRSANRPRARMSLGRRRRHLTGGSWLARPSATARQLCGSG
jgi:hypothetical protein